MKIENRSNDKRKRSECVALAMALVMLFAVFTAAIPSAIAQEPPGPPNPPLIVSETSSLRVYGEGNMGPEEEYDAKGQMVYDNYTDPFDPTVLQKDSITFNPAIILWDGRESPMSANSTNIHEKKFLRMWYEPEHIYTKPHYCHPTIEVESTYLLIDRQDYQPISGPANTTYFKFPIVEIPGQTGLGAFENEEGEPTRKNVVRVAGVWANDDPVGAFQKSTNGTIRIEKTYTLMPDEKVQFLDFWLQYKYIVVRNAPGTQAPDHFAKVKIWYAGNYEDDTEVTTVLGRYDNGADDDPHGTTWFKRHGERYDASNHDDHITWYARFEDEIILAGDNAAEITVGKEISAGDTFYVNGMRYDVPAVEVLDENGDRYAEEFKYITIRTPLPKGDGREVPDDNKISSQWIVTLPPETVIPLNPPFNLPTWKMVDDINVVLWEPLKHHDQWPMGNPDGNPGAEYFPLAERYLTMQYPPAAWQYYFRAVPIDTDNDMTPQKMPNDYQIWDGPYYPDDNLPENWTVGVCGKTMDAPDPDDINDFDEEHWIAYDVDERILDVEKPLQVVYLDETEEPRYSTNLLEILNETGMGTEDLEELWTKYDIQTLPDRYTEFVLPALPDVLTPEVVKPGDYLLTSSFIAPNALNFSNLNRSSWDNVPRVAFAYDVDYENGVGDGLDIYVNQWGGTSSIRIYGEDNMGPIQGYKDEGRAIPYADYWDPFDPTVLEKDSITFNPAIVEWDGNLYPMSIGSKDIDMKTFLRLWYEPLHTYSKEKYCRPTIEVETTYMPIYKQTKKPIGIEHIEGEHFLAKDAFIMFPIAEDETTDTPGLELIENPNSEPDRLNVVKVSVFHGKVAAPDYKEQDGKVRIEKTYKLDIGDKVQFLDHKLTFVGIVVRNAPGSQYPDYYAKVKVDYAGNRDDDTGATVVLGAFDNTGEYGDPHDTTWFKRHSETYDDFEHPEITWFARLENYNPDYEWAEITVGKQLQAGVMTGEGDVFYVDGVRYDVAAIETVGTDDDGWADEVKYITLRTPFPKCIATGISPVPDDGIISSQWIECIPPYEPIPLLPPFNWEHTLIDDIDVELWEPLKMPAGAVWPTGNPAGNRGTEYFPLAERYLTMQYPPSAWQYYFRAVPIDTDNDMDPKMPNDYQIWAGPYYPGNVSEEVPEGWELGWCTRNMSLPDCWYDFNETAEKWIAHDVNERIIPEPYDPLVIIYVDEFMEPRYSTNLLEILYENITGTARINESWTKYDIQTLPDQYTEFVLPKDEAHAGQLLMNDYLITSSFLAPNADTKSELERVPDGPGIPRLGFVFDAFDSLAKTGLYVNELVMTPPEPENKAPVLTIAVDPTVVTALQAVTVDTMGTYDDQYPVKISVDWDDGTVETVWMADAPSAPSFTHKYYSSGPYTVTVTATDKFGASDTKFAAVTVTNDGAVLEFNYGWNAISAPVQDTRSMGDLFVGPGKVPGFYAVYWWDNSAQEWQAQDLSHPLDPAKGYFIWATDYAAVELTGTAAAPTPSLLPGWNLVGVGAVPKTLSAGYAYLYEHAAGTYIPTRDMEPGYGYFIYVG